LLSPQSTTTFDGRSIAAGVMVRVAGNGSVNFGGDGGLASMSDLSTPIGLAGLSDGGVVIADTDNNRVRMIPGTTLHAYGRTLEAHHIYTILGDGSIGPTIAGSLGTRTSIGEPVAVAVDALNDIFALSRLSNQLFVIPANGESFLGRPVQAGHVYLVAGDGSSGFSGDGGRPRWRVSRTSRRLRLIRMGSLSLTAGTAGSGTWHCNLASNLARRG